LRARRNQDIVVLRRTLTPAQPAVLPGELTVTPANAAPGQPVTVTALLRNLGDAPVNTVQLALNLSDARLPAQSAPVSAIANTTVPQLRGGEALPVNFVVTLPARPNRLSVSPGCSTPCAPSGAQGSEPCYACDR
jgi:hypothetical protein